MESDIVDLTITQAFYETEWIGLGKLYPSDPPQFILDARARLLEIPDTFQSHIPADDVPVSHFLAWHLPRQVNAALNAPVKEWFSIDAPHTQPACLLTRDIPSATCLNQLDQRLGQAWFEGAKSISDPRYNNGRDRIPLWAITFWKTVARILSLREMWLASASWIVTEKKKVSIRDIETFSAFQVADKRLTSMPWRSQLPYSRGLARTTDLTIYLSERWLSDDSINMMTTLLSQDFAISGCKEHILIASLGVANEIMKNGPTGTYPIKNGAALLRRYEKYIQENRTEKLYFPANVGNHWIACCIDFERKVVSYGDSLRTHSPTIDTLMEYTRTWLKVRFGFDFTITGNALPHGVQNDTVNCGIIAMNTIETNALGRKLWTEKNAKLHRVMWFNRLAAFCDTPSLQLISQTPSVNAQITKDTYLSALIAIGDHNFPDLQTFVLKNMNKTVSSKKPLAEKSYKAVPSDASPPNPSSFQGVPSDQNMSTAIRPIPQPPASKSPPQTPPFQIASPKQQPSIIAEPSTISKDPIPISVGIVMDLDPTLPSVSKPEKIVSVELDKPSLPATRSEGTVMDKGAPKLGDAVRKQTTCRKRPFSLLDDLSDSEGSEYETDTAESVPKLSQNHPAPKKAPKAQTPKTKGTKAKQQRIEGKKDEVDDDKFEKWKRKLTADDPHVWFDPLNVCRVRHSKCPKAFLVKYPCDVSRWNEHLNKCGKKKDLTSNAGAKTFSQPLISSRMPSWGLASSKSATKHTDTVTHRLPCPGLRETDDDRIPAYLQRTSAKTAGGVAIDELPGEKFEGKFRDLPEKEKERLRLVQMHTHRWRNLHNLPAVFSINCLKFSSQNGSYCSACAEVLALRAFKNALRKDIPHPENRKFTNKVNRDPVLGGIYASVVGLQDLIEKPDVDKNVFVRFAQGVLGGKYDNKVLMGLIEATVLKQDRLEQGKGMQNFPWTPDYDEFSHIMQIISPQFSRTWREIFPAPSERTHRRREARQPQFPQEVGDEMFERVLQHFNTINYHGPCCLSCDDTKLLSAYRPYFDGEKQKYFLVGGIDGPIEVLNPETMDALMDETKKAVKVRVFCLSIPFRKIPPIIVAALPIPDNLKVETLFPLSLQILRGLLSRGINVISYACDGTEIERKIQHQFRKIATSHLRYTIASPAPGGADINIAIPVIDGHPLSLIQDSRHSSKTLRNNLFSGSTLLVLGNETAQFSHIQRIIDHQLSPIYRRDVEKLDRQDDNAATRLFAAETLKFTCDRHEAFKAEIPYLFIFGELTDAYQNRSISHIERVQMVLRAHYFLDGWLKALELSSHSKKKHTLSREALDILKFIIHGLLELIFIHRDHIGTRTPLLTWLHSSEVCEHVFGEARRIVKDFTLLDLFYMIPKLRVKIRHAVFQERVSDPNARASGYSHRYYVHGDDINLAHFPSDAEIAQAARIALDEADSLLMFLGLKPHLLRSMVQNPGIQTHLSVTLRANEEHDGDVNPEEVEIANPDEADDEETSLEELLRRIRVEDDKIHRDKTEHELLSLTSASIALLVGDMEKIQSICPDEDIEKLAAEERTEINAVMNEISDAAAHTTDNLVGQVPMQSTFSDIDFSGLINTRRRHETLEAAMGVRARGKDVEGDKEDTEDDEKKPKLSERQEMIKQIHEKLKLYNKDRGVGTGLERGARWKGTDPDPGPVGHAKNAAAMAQTNTSLAAQKRRKIFTSLKVPELERLITAGITKVRKLEAHGIDFVFVIANEKIMVGKVIGLQTKSAGKNVRHQSSKSTDNISSASYVSVQVFEHTFGGRFTALTSRTTWVGTNQFEHLPPSQVLCILSSQPRAPSLREVQLGQIDLNVFTNLCGGLEALKLAMAEFRKKEIK
ncbi:hypothetical protein BDN72DRAFT_953706 [Pluteus cervinus]|uniref:Uncharacterized protein n=1 Tax=Pluteus cervinus TaxID=181527 RepID=A0ACD3BGB0_9AGAR|nr:hypothetical protein BDN72DRAFT_953706 [Pluteus cervinus]